MRVLLFGLLAALVAGDRCGRECAQKGQVRLDIQEVRLNHLTAKIQELEDTFDERVSSGNSAHNVLASLGARLQSITGSGCPDGYYACGGNDNQCVDNLLVCDGNKDCMNGHDEESSTCTVLAEAGSHWHGVPVRDACTTRQPYELDIVVSDTSRLDFYSSRVDVHASILTRSKDQHSTSTANLPTTGYYNFATRQLILAPPESDGLGMIVDFNTGDDNVANGYVTRVSTLERCALFVLRRD